MKTLCLAAAAVTAVIFTGCATTTPPELTNARTAYQEAAQAPGASYATVDVYEAKKSLDRAEKAFADDGDEPETRDLAYVAQRKALIAKSRGNTAIAQQQQRDALAEADRVKQQQAMATRSELGKTKEQLAQLEAERDARAKADKAIEKALATMGLKAKHDERGIVMTLSDSLPFATGKSDIPAGGQKKIAVLAAAMRDGNRKITIVGHTDSTGDPQKNQTLSQSRADAVRWELIKNGIAEARVTAQGVGSAEPLADNKTATGRAENRRVEMILSTPKNESNMQDNEQKTKTPATDQRMPMNEPKTPTTEPRR